MSMPSPIEYRNPLYDAHASTREILATHTDELGRTFSLAHVSAGYEPAGSMGRYTPECWRVCWELRDSTRGGRTYRTEAEAREDYERCAGGA